MTRPELIDERSAYQNGVLDALRGAESAAALLTLAGQLGLAVAYAGGFCTGGRLESDELPGLVYTEVEG